MAVAAGLIIGQADYKRMLAYSSVEHMGILAVGIGLGGAGDWGALFHAVNHSLTKAALFLLAGNILAAYGTKRVCRRRAGPCAGSPSPARCGSPGSSPSSAPRRSAHSPASSPSFAPRSPPGSWVVVVLYSLSPRGGLRGNDRRAGAHGAGREGTGVPGGIPAGGAAQHASAAVPALVAAASATRRREPVLAVVAPLRCSWRSPAPSACSSPASSTGRCSRRHRCWGYDA